MRTRSSQSRCPLRIRALPARRAAGWPPARAARGRPLLSVSISRDLVWVLGVYLGTRCMLLLAAYLQAHFGNHDFLHELSNWDGLWYRKVANQGYLPYPSDRQTTLGFFPLFPLFIYIVEPIFKVTGHDAIWSSSVSGILISGVGGAIASIYAYRLAEGWWDRFTARRATLLFILFPGSVVFSMVYSEGLMMPLALACIYYLERKRWLLAGILAGFATAVQPVSVVLIPVCTVSALLEWRRRGFTLAVLRRVIVAPLLSGLGTGVLRAVPLVLDRYAAGQLPGSASRLE